MMNDTTPDHSTPADSPFATLEALAASGLPDAAPRLIMALKDPDPRIRRTAASELGRLGDASTVPDLMNAVRDSDPSIRQAAVAALGMIGQPSALTGLLTALRDPYPDVRRTAAWALGRLQDIRAHRGLMAATLDPSAGVRSAAQAALKMLDVGEPTNVSQRRGPHRKRSKHRTLAAVGVTAIIVGSLLITGVIAWNRSLGPPLVPLETAGSLDNSSAPEAVAEASQIPAGNPVCGGPRVMMLLLVATDNYSNDYNTGFADVIRVARVDFVAQRVVLLAVPRDLWVVIPGLEQYGVVSNRIKTAYAYGNHYQVPGAGPSLLAQTLDLNFGLRVEHYAVINFTAFEAGIDAIGGLDLYLPEPVDDSRDSLPPFPAGWQHMDGYTALRYARIRPDNSSDLFRIDRQTQILNALREKMFSPQFLPALPGFISSMRGATLTDLSPAQISSLLCLGERLSDESIFTITIDGELVTSVIDDYGFERLLPNLDAIRLFVDAFEAGDPAILQTQSN